MKNKIITLIVLIFLSLIIVGCTNKSEPVKEEKKENEGKSKKSAKIAGLNKFLRMYYGIVKRTYKEQEKW